MENVKLILLLSPITIGLSLFLYCFLLLALPNIKDLLNYLGRLFKIKVTIGKPDFRNKPKWANFLKRTPTGEWHWLEKDSIIDSGFHDEYFPYAGKTEFSGYIERRRD